MVLIVIPYRIRIGNKKNRVSTAPGIATATDAKDIGIMIFKLLNLKIDLDLNINLSIAIKTANPIIKYQDILNTGLIEELEFI